MPRALPNSLPLLLFSVSPPGPDLATTRELRRHAIAPRRGERRQEAAPLCPNRSPSSSTTIPRVNLRRDPLEPMYASRIRPRPPQLRRAIPAAPAALRPRRALQNAQGELL